MKAITTKYHGPSNVRGSRVSASDLDGNRVTISYPYELSGEDVHRKAADALCAKMGWTGALAGGAVKHGYVFVFTGAPFHPQGFCQHDEMPSHNRKALGKKIKFSDLPDDCRKAVKMDCAS